MTLIDVKDVNRRINYGRGEIACTHCPVARAIDVLLKDDCDVSVGNDYVRIWGVDRKQTVLPLPPKAHAFIARWPYDPGTPFTFELDIPERLLKEQPAVN